MTDSTYVHVNHGQNIFTRALSKIWAGLVILGESNSRAQIAREICNLSDEDLEKMGLTRAELVRRVMIDGYGL
jgi:hypothetical protein